MSRLAFRRTFHTFLSPTTAARHTAQTWTRSWARGRFNSTQTLCRWFSLGTAGIVLAVSLSVANQRKVYSDAPPTQEVASKVIKWQDSEETIVDPATSISFPKTLAVPTKIRTPPLSLVGLGVRTVSFLGIKVYSVGFYADLNNPNLKIPKYMSPEEKAKYIIRNTTCAIRIVPTRTTSYSHLRDAFMRALQARIAKAKLEGTLTEEEAINAGSPMRKLKSLFPNASLAKHTPFDILLTGPVPGRPRTLVFRDLGVIESDWVAVELVSHYIEGDAPSPALKKSVLEELKLVEK
ncbi:hypothetical protein APHAL10511_008333 [Amanita phalloides]|nr:hypothetical protein APHAL10511_008333 [Amanita phalloides]